MRLSLARRAMIVALALSAGAAPAQAGSASPATVDGPVLSLDLTPPADTGKPRPYTPPPLITPPTGCAAAFDCRVRIIGTIQHNGAVELNATALKW